MRDQPIPVQSLEPHCATLTDQICEHQNQLHVGGFDFENQNQGANTDTDTNTETVEN